RARDDRRDLGRRVTLVRERDRESVELGEAYAGPFAEGREVLGAGEQEEADAGHGAEERHTELGDVAQGLGQAEEESRRRGMQTRQDVAAPLELGPPRDSREDHRRTSCGLPTGPPD